VLLNKEADKPLCNQPLEINVRGAVVNVDAMSVCKGFWRGLSLFAEGFSNLVLDIDTLSLVLA